MKKIYNYCIFQIRINYKFYFMFWGVYIILLPMIGLLLQKKGDLDVENFVLHFFQLGYPLISGVFYVIFMQPVIDEDGREVFYVNKRLFLPDSLVFASITGFIAYASLMILDLINGDFKMWLFLVLIEIFLVIGILYAVLYYSNSCVIAISVLLLCFIVSTIANISFFSIIIYMNEFRSVLTNCFIHIGFILIVWSLGGIRNVFYSCYE